MKKITALLSVYLFVSLAIISSVSAAAKDSLGSLAEVIDDLVYEGTVDVSMATPLSSKINAAIKSVAKNSCSSVNQIEAFINQVSAQQGKKISNEASEELISYANTVIGEMNKDDTENCATATEPVPTDNDVPAVSNVPDTGQTTSFTNTFGEDSDYSINPPSYTDLGDGTVIDDVTGLMWQQEDDDMRRSWQDAGTYCSDITLGGHADWRLPNFTELVSILKLTQNTGPESIPTIDTVAFPGTGTAGYYWSSSIGPEDIPTAWPVSFRNGFANRFRQTSPMWVRCVRGQEYSPGSFVDNGDSTVTDNVTGLMWQQTESGRKSFEDALRHCEDLTLAGHNNWRLPNYKELESISDETKFDPTIDEQYFPKGRSAFYWTSTTYVLEPTQAYVQSFWVSVMTYVDKDWNAETRCVR